VTFLLQYKDEIPSDQGPPEDRRIDIKRQVRRVFSEQLARRWRDSRLLSKWDTKQLPVAKQVNHQYELSDDDLPEHSLFFEFSYVALRLSRS
jgi:hypothetical protein